MIASKKTMVLGHGQSSSRSGNGATVLREESLLRCIVKLTTSILFTGSIYQLCGRLLPFLCCSAERCVGKKCGQWTRPMMMDTS